MICGGSHCATPEFCGRNARCQFLHISTIVPLTAEEKEARRLRDVERAKLQIEDGILRLQALGEPLPTNLFAQTTS